MSPATTFGEPRRQNLTASGGNPALKPFEAERSIGLIRTI